MNQVWIALGASAFLAANCLGCGTADPGSGADGAAGNAGDSGSGPLLPWATGNTWTYRITEASGVSTKVNTVGDLEPVGGTGPNKNLMAFKVVTSKGVAGTDQTISWQADIGSKIIRYREQSFAASTGTLELEEHWDPHKIHIDGTAMNTTAGATWLETYLETKQVPLGQPTTATARDRWTVISTSQSVTVPAGTFNAIVFQKVGGSSSKTYWYVRGLGKVKESGGQLEELMSYHLVP